MKKLMGSVEIRGAVRCCEEGGQRLAGENIFAQARFLLKVFLMFCIISLRSKSKVETFGEEKEREPLVNLVYSVMFE